MNNRRRLNKLERALDGTIREIDSFISAGHDKIDLLKNYAGEAAILIVYSAEISSKAIDEALQIMGGQGFMDAHPIEAMYRDARITRIYEGTNEVCRLQSLMYLKKLNWFDKLSFKITYGRDLELMKKGPDHISVEIFELADRLINIYIDKWN